jgi:hypothetical protein
LKIGPSSSKGKLYYQVVLTANKLARIIWATWKYERPFDGNWKHPAPAVNAAA